MARVARFTQGDQNPVGMWAYSDLTEAQFQELNGTSWVLADGRNVAGSRYSTITGKTTVPDARGMTLRGKNNGRSDGNQDPDGERALGSFQADAFGSHTHAQDPHSHTVRVPNVGYALQVASIVTTGTGTNVNTNIQNVTGVNNSTTGTNQNTGGNETRMKNLAANLFIKIN